MTQTPGTIAVDVALLLPPELNERVKAWNAAVWAQGQEGFLFDATRLPHITLFQLAIEAVQQDELCERVAAVASKHQALDLRAPEILQTSSSVQLVVERHARLKELHEELVECLSDLALDEVAPAAFFRPDVEPRERDQAWVRRFREDSSHELFEPHVTVGKGPAPLLAAPLSFRASRLAVCQLGRFCTCRRIFQEWGLKTVR